MEIEELKFKFPEYFKRVLTCPVCDRVFGTNSARAVYCSDACRMIAYRQRRYNSGRGRRAVMRGQVSTIQTACSNCGKLMKVKPGSNKKYCSGACRQAAYRKRQNNAEKDDLG